MKKTLIVAGLILALSMSAGGTRLTNKQCLDKLRNDMAWQALRMSLNFELPRECGGYAVQKLECIKYRKQLNAEIIRNIVVGRRVLNRNSCYKED